jgi:RNA-binding protein 5/10
LLSFLLSPQSQPHGFLIANRPIATSFADPASFEATEAGLLGGQYLLRATANGGIGSDTKDKSEGGWCIYANEQAGAIEAVPAKSKVPDDGVLPEMTSQLRSFLGVYAGKVDQIEDKAPVAPVGMVNIANVMQPIKIGTGFAIGGIGKGKKEEGLAGPSRKNLFDDDEEVDTVGKDTVLLSRSKSPTFCNVKCANALSKRSTYCPTHIWESEGEI